ncbi:hypothetical protein [Thiocapsa rosea]|uniref:Uncharacterized protein n=1 Tax=Thiocapsa rosea TaxID=69360 RepID=A0A495V359_9GAMM|nr:hypothetical protein [Thiocapsa rosea]RKT43831.1 hypothetical protein BDD21_1191 [Thiocapsa rosea]
MSRNDHGKSTVQAEIDIRIARIDQLFETFDPSPFRERDLDPAATAFIVDWARELNRSIPIELHLHVRYAGPEQEAPEEVVSAIQGYFQRRADAATREIRELFRTGRIYLLVGLLILLLSLGGAEAVIYLFGNRPSVTLLAESLIILGWVANWKPLEIFLYDWWPIRRDARLFRRLAAARVTVQG